MPPTVTACVPTQPGAEPLTTKALRAFLSDDLGRHEPPTQLELRAALSCTAVGKLSQRDLMNKAAHLPKHDET